MSSPLNDGRIHDDKSGIDGPIWIKRKKKRFFSSAREKSETYRSNCNKGSCERRGDGVGGPSPASPFARLFVQRWLEQRCREIRRNQGIYCFKEDGDIAHTHTHTVQREREKSAEFITSFLLLPKRASSSSRAMLQSNPRRPPGQEPSQLNPDRMCFVDWQSVRQRNNTKQT